LLPTRAKTVFLLSYIASALKMNVVVLSGLHITTLPIRLAPDILAFCVIRNYFPIFSKFPCRSTFFDLRLVGASPLYSLFSPSTFFFDSPHTHALEVVAPELLLVPSRVALPRSPARHLSSFLRRPFCLPPPFEISPVDRLTLQSVTLFTFYPSVTLRKSCLLLNAPFSAFS